VKRRFRGAADMRESTRRENFPEACFSGLRTQSQAHFLS
jgi:hypothetical protein